MEKQRGNPSRQEEEDSEDSDNPEAEIWHKKGEPVVQNSKAWGQSFCIRSQLEVQRVQKRRGDTTSTYRRTHRTAWKPSSPWSGKSMEDNLAIL